jgi:hypothetical protein
MKYHLPFLYDYVFPNLILPNALITEYGIINYLHTLYSNKNSNNCFTDPSATFNAAYSIFDNKLGHWPNSLRQNGTNLNSIFYTNDHLKILEDSIYFGKQRYPKYIYPIRITPHIDEFIGVNLGTGNKLNGEYFWKHMSDEALQDARNGRALIFIDYAQENFIEKETYENFHEALRHSGIPKEQIILAFNTFNGRELYESWFTPDERRLKVCNWPYVMHVSSFFYDINPNRRLDQERFNNTRTIKRKNHFLFKIRNSRQHRMVLLYKMATDNLLIKGDWSCLTQFQFNENDVRAYINTYKFDLNIDIIRELCNSLPQVLQSEPENKHELVSAWTDYNITPHSDSYFYICTETFMHGDHKSLTEKVFKPLVNFQPFLFLAYPGALSLLRSLGFKTFSPFIDESYDLEQNENIRVNMIFKEINRLCNMSKDEIHEWYWGMESILIHNHRQVLELHRNETRGLTLIKYLHQRVNS